MAYKPNTFLWRLALNPLTKRLKKRVKRGLMSGTAAETAATTAGIRAFHAEQSTFEVTSPLLRRNIHRLEKGLAMPERRGSFGAKFIEETVHLYARLSKSDKADAAESAWARDVLGRYFATVDRSDRAITRAYKQWETLGETEQTDHTPYPFTALTAYVGPEQVADFDAFSALCRARRSVRWYKPDPVPTPQVEKAMAAALQSPSAYNRQPFRFHLAQSRAMVKAITDLPLGTAGFGEDLPAVIAVVGNLANYAEPRDRHLIYIDAALAAMPFMLALTAQGLGSVPINWPDLPENHDALRKLLGLADYEVPIMLIGLGIPRDEGMIAYSAKKDISQVLIYAD